MERRRFSVMPHIRGAADGSREYLHERFYVFFLSKKTATDNTRTRTGPNTPSNNASTETRSVVYVLDFRFISQEQTEICCWIALHHKYIRTGRPTCMYCSKTCLLVAKSRAVRCWLSHRPNSITRDVDYVPPGITCCHFPWPCVG